MWTKVWRVSPCVGLCIMVMSFTAGCSPVDTEATTSDYQPPPVVAPAPIENTASTLDHYRAAAECEGKDYDDVMALGNQSADLPTLDGAAGFQITLNLRQRVAHIMIELAEDADAKGCVKTARKTYLAIIDTFTGSAYEAVRQRAQIGIDDLRAAQMQPKHHSASQVN
jgi:hypothetical protein